MPDLGARAATGVPDQLVGRIGLVIGQLTHGGAERQLFELARGLASMGARPQVYCLSEADAPYGPALASEGIPVHVVPRRRGFELRRARRLAAEFRSSRLELVHSFLFIANAYAWAACRLAGVPHFLPSVRNLEPHRPLLGRLIDGLVLRRAPAVLVNAEFLADWVSETYRVDRSRLRVVPNGLDASRFEAVPPMPGRRSGGAVVGSVSLFKKQKRLPFLLDVATSVLRMRPETRFRFVGDGPERPEVLRLRDRMGLAHAVELPGKSEDVPAELVGFDVFVLASDREGMPNAILEAMAAARPVVASAVPGTDEVIRQNETGLLFPPEDVEAAARAIVSLIDDPARASSMGREGRRLALTSYSEKRMVERTLEIYRELLAPSIRTDGTRTAEP